MNRSANCIQMLQLLKSRELLSREELASLLDTNIRNIAEYRKELEMAGYVIESVRGKHGGYRMMNDHVLKVPGFTSSQRKAIQETIHFLSSHPDFLFQHDFIEAMDKLKAGMEFESKDTQVYMSQSINISDKIKEMIKVMEEAKDLQQSIELTYQSMNRSRSEKVIIHPYEIIYYKNSYYCIAYSLKAKDFRIYKFSEERMKNVEKINRYFNRDLDFDIKKHIGNSGLMKHEIFEVELLIKDSKALLICEQQVGINPKMEWLKDGRLYLKTILEGKMDTISFILSLGEDVEMIKPDDLKLEIRGIVERMFYQST